MKSVGISTTLRRLRLARGLTTAALARRAGTSPATVSRYERGWTRFELYTLRKLATALGARLELSWYPAEPRRSRGAHAAARRRLERLFWDRPLTERDLKRYPDWVAGRVLQYGTIEDVRALVRALGRQRFLSVVGALRLPTPRLRAFWKSVLELEGVPCTKRLSRPQAVGSWPA